MRRFLIALLIILITVKCSTKKDDIYISNYEDKYELHVIDTLTYYYQDSLFIGRIHDIQLIGDKILISDFFLKKIWVFSNKLNLLKVVGREGNGPGEYMYAPNIIYNSNYIWLSSGRIIDKYNRNLEFIKRMQLPKELIYSSNTPICIGDFFIFNVSFPYSIVEKSYYEKFKPLIKIDTVLSNYVNFDDWDENYFNDELEGYTREQHESLVTKKDENHFFTIQGATYYIKLYDKNLNVLRHFGRKPKKYKDPPKLKARDTQASVEANAKFHSNITRWHNLKYDTYEKRLYLGYTNLFEDFYLYRSLMRGEHYLEVFDENYNVIYDDKLPGILAFVNNGMIYVIHKEDPKFLKLLVCRLREKDDDK